MSLLSELHSAHKARLARMGRAAVAIAKAIPELAHATATPPPPEPLPVLPHWLDGVVDGAETVVNPTILQIQKAICRYYELSHRELISQRRSANLMRPRQVGYYLCRELTGKSFPFIGKHFGLRDHTTILWGAKRIERQIQLYPSLANEVSELTRIISGGVRHDGN